MNESNLTPVRTENEARKKGKAGGIASGEARRRKKDLRECLMAVLDGKDSEGLTGAERLAATLVKSALDGNVRAFAEIRDTVYGRPVSTIEMTGKDETPIQPPVINVHFIEADGRQ
ncbi:MAG: hypothetical protein KIG68_00280 [Oxalobacter sp.]|nr:hypothetical protein [Oxalobacter sp.]